MYIQNKNKLGGKNMTDGTKYKSFVIGFCKCANCGWTDGKFNWHTHFRCPQCKCEEYVKEFINGEKAETVDSGMSAMGTDDYIGNFSLCFD